MCIFRDGRETGREGGIISETLLSSVGPGTVWRAMRRDGGVNR